ncbi:MAG: DUF4174 domain-containing protein [Bryobacterales bacterium]|jgi:hypothetical protein|nr:DUF4174 domain-containing protein [Bryobacterales bacterium]
MRWLTCCVLLLLGAGPGGSQDADFRLSDLQWKHRVLLVFSPSQGDAGFQRQYAAWRRALAGMEERDLVWVPLVTGETAKAAGRAVSVAAQQQLRRQYEVADQDFAVLLVGRDGGVKLRQNTPVDAPALFALIDSMPMRQQEVRQQGKRRPEER